MKTAPIGQQVNVLPSKDAKGPNFASTRNACKLCTPLGACLAFAGIAGARTILHGSQGCSTYIRRYMISHYKEPVDIASSNFHEQAAVFGGKENLCQALDNVTRQYRPDLLGVATTCLAETIGDDVGMFLKQIRKDAPHLPSIVNVSTASYRGTHADGFFATVKALVEQLVEPTDASTSVDRAPHINLLPGMLSPADLRYLKEICGDFHLPVTLLPDYSDTLDGGNWETYHLIPKGGTAIEDIHASGRARATVECSFVEDSQKSAGGFLKEHHGVSLYQLGLPIGVLHTDELFDALATISGRPIPEKYNAERGRLVDSYVDGHKYLFDRKAVVFGEEDMVVGIANFLAEIGVTPVLCASGGTSGQLKSVIRKTLPELANQIEVLQGVDYAEIEEEIAERKPDLLIGPSKGYKLARRLGIPLIRVGFPIHDRVGGARILHVGYRGAQQLFDHICNSLIERTQETSDVGYSYL